MRYRSVPPVVHVRAHAGVGGAEVDNRGLWGQGMGNGVCAVVLPLLRSTLSEC